MSTTIQLAQATLFLEKPVRIQGHLQSMRDLGQIMFLVVRDGTAAIQVVVESADLQTQLRTLASETPCIFTGTLKSPPQKNGIQQKGAELLLTEVTP